MISKISVRNYGRFGNDKHEVFFAPETIIVGANNSGKSTFISAINVIAQTLKRVGVQGPGTTISSQLNIQDEAKFGVLPNAAHNNKREGSMELGIEGSDASFNLRIDGPIYTQFSLTSNGKDIASIQQLAQTIFNTRFLLSTRGFVPTQSYVATGQPPNIVTAYLERWTSRDDRWDLAETWLKKIDPTVRILKTPLRGAVSSIEMSVGYPDGTTDINASLMGSGMQRAFEIIYEVIFSPPGSTIIIEEPEMNLHPESQQLLVDLFNEGVNKFNKQIIVTTHSWDIILPFESDIGKGTPRGDAHEKADKSKFKLIRFLIENQTPKIIEYDLRNNTFDQFKRDFKIMWG